MSHINNISSQKGEGWVEERLGELGKIQTGSTPKTSQPDNFGDFIPFIKPPDFDVDGRINYNNEGLSEKGLEGSRLIDAGSVLMVCIGATIGKVGFNDRDVAANQQINALTPTPNISSKFLYYQMLTSSFQKAVFYNSAQATLPIINKTKWSNLTVSVPALPEQKRIVAILDEAFAAIAKATANAEKNLANARELFESKLTAAFKDTGDGWTEKTLGEVCEIASRLVDPRSPEYVDLPHVGAGNMVSKTGKLVDVQTAKEEGLKSGKFVITTDSKNTMQPAPDLIQRQFEVASRDKAWVSDTTFIATRQGWLYLAIVLDLFSRQVIGWAMGTRNNTELVQDALTTEINGDRFIIS